MRLPRFTTRRLMVVVAVVAIGIVGWKQYQYGETMRPNYKQCVFWYGTEERIARQYASITHEQWVAEQQALDRRWRESGPDLVREALEWHQAKLPPGRHEQWIAERRAADRELKRNRPPRVWGPSHPPAVERRRAKYFARLRVKYEFASRFPWLPVAPDPPLPSEFISPPWQIPLEGIPNR